MFLYEYDTLPGVNSSLNQIRTAPAVSESVPISTSIAYSVSYTIESLSNTRVNSTALLKILNVFSCVRELGWTSSPSPGCQIYAEYWDDSVSHVVIDLLRNSPCSVRIKI